ncbi:MAG: hypothetical protein LBR51_06850 [Bacteroidales bacterium]|jgi:hypothetical protein|nr:hypothetical protein [Bacteroidales bacterium]
MDKFDLWIKETAELEKPAFKEKYWRSFARKAGMKIGMSGSQKALWAFAGGIAAASVIGVLYWIGTPFVSPTLKGTQPIQINAECPIPSPLPTENPSCVEKNVKDSHASLPEVTLPATVSKNKISKPTVAHTASVMENTPTEDTLNNAPIKPYQNNYGRVLYIDIDTIKDAE